MTSLYFLLDTAVRVISIVQHLSPVIEAVSDASVSIPEFANIHSNLENGDADRYMFPSSKRPCLREPNILGLPLNNSSTTDLDSELIDQQIFHHSSEFQQLEKELETLTQSLCDEVAMNNALSNEKQPVPIISNPTQLPQTVQVCPSQAVPVCLSQTAPLCPPQTAHDCPTQTAHVCPSQTAHVCPPQTVHNVESSPSVVLLSETENVFSNKTQPSPPLSEDVDMLDPAPPEIPADEAPKPETLSKDPPVIHLDDVKQESENFEAHVKMEMAYEDEYNRNNSIIPLLPSPNHTTAQATEHDTERLAAAVLNSVNNLNSVSSFLGSLSQLSLPGPSTEGQPSSIGGCKTFDCSFCDYTTLDKMEYVKHIRNHTGDKPYTCQICDYKSDHRGNLVIHMRTHTQGRLYHCKLCSFRTSRRMYLHEHMESHAIEEKPFVCVLCDYRTARKANLGIHMGSQKHMASVMKAKVIGQSSLNVEN